MNFKPLGKRVLIERLEEVSKTASGIYIPDNAKEKSMQGKVVSIGSKVAEECNCFKEGDIVLFSSYKGDEIKIEGKTYLVLELEDLLGVIK